LNSPAPQKNKNLSMMPSTTKTKGSQISNKKAASAHNFIIKILNTSDQKPNTL